jgi:uncharacterized membrane protein (Fun14 family)
MSEPPPDRPRAHEQFARHIRSQPRWHKSLLGVMVVLAVLGVVGQVRAKLSKPRIVERTETSATSANNSSTPANSRGFVSQDSTAQAPAPAAADRVPTQPVGNDDLFTRVSPYATRLGVGYVAGFIIGWVFRFFLKTMMMITLVVGGLFAALSYFHVVNVDLTPAKQQYDSAMHWASDQASKLKDAAMAHLPSGGATTVGAFLGFRRRRVD